MAEPIVKRRSARGPVATAVASLAQVRHHGRRMTRQLPFSFADPAPLPARLVFAPGALLLGGLQAGGPGAEAEVLEGGGAVAAGAPFGHMTTPGGFRMSVAMTSCGRVGWVSDESGYRYAERDPERAAPWPAMPEAFLRIARAAASEAGYPGFDPDACLVNRYVPEARMTLHQDKDERDFSAPVRSVSLGFPGTLVVGGTTPGGLGGYARGNGRWMRRGWPSASTSRSSGPCTKPSGAASSTPLGWRALPGRFGGGMGLGNGGW